MVFPVQVQKGCPGGRSLWSDDTEKLSKRRTENNNLWLFFVVLVVLFCFFPHSGHMWIPGQGLNSNHSCDNAGFLTHTARLEIEPALPQKQRWIFNSLLHSGNSSLFIYCYNLLGGGWKLYRYHSFILKIVITYYSFIHFAYFYYMPVIFQLLYEVLKNTREKKQLSSLLSQNK